MLDGTAPAVLTSTIHHTVVDLLAFTALAFTYIICHWIEAQKAYETIELSHTVLAVELKRKRDRDG